MKLIKSITNNKKIFTLLLLSFMLINKSIEAYAAIPIAVPINSSNRYSNDEYVLDNAQSYFTSIIVGFNQLGGAFKSDSINYYNNIKLILTYNAKSYRCSIDDEINQLDVIFEDYLESNDPSKLEEFKKNFNELFEILTNKRKIASFFDGVFIITVIGFAFVSIPVMGRLLRR